MKLNEVATSFEKDPGTINVSTVKDLMDRLTVSDREGKELRKQVLALLRTIVKTYQASQSTSDHFGQPHPKTLRRLSRSSQIINAAELMREVDMYAYRKIIRGYAADLRNPRLIKLLQIVAQGMTQ